MKKIEVKWGKVSGYQRIYLNPILYLDYQLDKGFDRHHLCINLVWITFGFGIGISWKNKNPIEFVPPWDDTP